MTTRITTYITFIFILFIVSCKEIREESLKSNLTSIVSETERNYKQFSPDDWAKKDEEIEKVLNSDYYPYRDEMAENKKREINELVGKYYSFKVKSGIIGLKNIIKDGVQQLETIVNELSTDSTLLK